MTRLAGRVFLFLAIALVVSCSQPSKQTPSGPEISADESPVEFKAQITPSFLVASETVGDSVIKDRYVVLFDQEKVKNAENAVGLLQRTFSITPHHIYTNGPRGFSATIHPNALEGLERNPLISIIEPDRVGTAPIHSTEPSFLGLEPY